MNQPTAEQFRMDLSQLVREDTYTDGRVGTVRALSPVTADGQPDPDRAISYYGQTQVMTPAGPLPLSFELPGDNLKTAIEGFGEAAAQAIEEAVEEIKRLQREQASSIVVPGQGGGGLGGLSGGGAGPGAGGRIKLR